MKYKYAFKSEKENVAKVVGRDLSMSRKQAIEMCSFIKNKPLVKAKVLMEGVKEKRIAVPFNRFTEGAGHKKGMSGGRYPFNGSKIFLMLLNSLEANAQNKGLGQNLMIVHACAQRATQPSHSGRKRGIKMKRCHIEIVAQEMEPEKKKAGKAKKEAVHHDSKDSKKQ
ncbi:MAG: 50S ribosomal protein L22 [archaeon]